MGRNRLSALVFAASFPLLGAPAWAGVYADNLGKCLVKSANPEDQLTLVQWMFSSLTLHPALQSMTTITPEQRDTYNKSMAALYDRLLYVDCRKEAVEGLRNEGPRVLGEGFTVLGQVASRDMFADPHVAQGLSGLVKYTDKSKASSLFREAGLARPQGQ